MNSNQTGASEPKKRGPKFSVHSLEKKIQKQKYKDEREVRRVLDDMVYRVEFKIKEEEEILKKFMIYKSQYQEMSQAG